MSREISQPSSGTCQSTDTDTSSEVTRSSTSGQSVDPSHQVQSSEEERNDASTESSELSRSTPESTSSGIAGSIDESASSEQVDGSSQQAVSGEWEIVGAGELSSAHQSANSDIPTNISQSSSCAESTFSTITQQNLVSKQVMESYAATPRDISRSIFQILDRQSELVKATLLQREQRRMKAVSQTSEQGKSSSNAPFSDETQSTASRQSEDLNRISQQIPLNEPITTDACSVGAGEPSRSHQSANSNVPRNTTDRQSEVLNSVPQQTSLSEQRTTGSTRGISEQGDEPRESTDTAAPQNKTQKPVNRRPEDSSHERRSRPRHSKRTTSRKDSRGNQSEEASAIIPEGMVNNAIRSLNDALVRNPELRQSGVLGMGMPLVIEANQELTEMLTQCRTVADMRDTLERLASREHASDDTNSEERQNDRQNDRRGVRGRGKQRSRKDIPPRGGGGDGGVK